MGINSIESYNNWLVRNGLGSLPGITSYLGQEYLEYLNYLNIVDQATKRNEDKDKGVEITIRAITSDSITESKGTQPFPVPVPTMENDVFFQFGAGAAAMWANFRRMEEVGWQLSDKYYHCMGNCQATNFGPGGEVAAKLLSYFKTNLRSKYWTERPDWRDDDKANRCGQRGGNCDYRCEPFIPKSSPGKPPFPGW
jgi:hypothetical protein